jgi:hypothetical protein
MHHNDSASATSEMEKNPFARGSNHTGSPLSSAASRGDNGPSASTMK